MFLEKKQGRRWLLVLFWGLITFSHCFSQSRIIQGKVLEEREKGVFIPLQGATVFWLGTPLGSATDSLGLFALAFPDSIPSPRLVVRYLGYSADTLEDFSTEKVQIILKQEEHKTLQEITVEGRGPTSFITDHAINTQVMTSRELVKAACCNLSESFETNPSVEVNYTDAVTGARQIQMLGLAGIYSLLTQENLPGNQGIFANYGLGFTPGSWIESIQVTKGVGSVANGYESMAGQINVELKKPDWNPKKRERLFINIYGNDMYRLEINMNSTQQWHPKIHATTFFHGNTQESHMDANKDGFRDIPAGKQINVMQRWTYADTLGWTAQWGGNWLWDTRQAGTFDHQSFPKYAIQLDNHQWGLFAKTGYIFPGNTFRSIGLMQSYSERQSTQNFASVNSYSGNQKTYYANLIYQSIIGSTNLTFRTGASFKWDQFSEKLIHKIQGAHRGEWERTEIVPGIFGELTWKPRSDFMFIGGLRADKHNMFGFWITPRLHLKYDIKEGSSIRITAGNGRRVANIFAENSGLLASARQIFLPSGSGLYNNTSQNFAPISASGLKPEMAWNYGLSWDHQWEFIGRNARISMDIFQTRFVNQVVVDVDASARDIRFYNLQGSSWSNAFQFMAEWEVLRRLDIRMAYKWLDVQQFIDGKIREKPYVAQHRFFINLAYETRSKWSFDLTLNWNSSKRLPSSANNPENWQWAERSPAFLLLQGQISKKIKRQWDFYLGSENLLNFRQKQLIIDPESPLGTYFDASVVWGPVIGRMAYVGLRRRFS